MTELLTVISIIFVVAGPLLLLANHLRLPTAPALIVAGLLVGGFIDETLKLEIARLGIALLVFTFAVRIQTEDLETAVADTEVVALAQLAVMAAAGLVAGVLLGFPLEQAVFVGVAAAVSSSIVGSTLFVPSAQELVHDRLSESIHSIQDFAALFILLVVGAGAFDLDVVATHLGYGVVLLMAAVFVNRYVFDAVGRFAGDADEPMLIGTVALLLVFLGGAEHLGVSIVVGAFAAGVAVQEDAVKYSGVINGLDSINDFFAAIFFITVGALATPFFASPSFDVVALTLALVFLAGVVKPMVTIALLMYRGYERRTASLTGFNLDQVGEFALIVAIEAVFLGLLVDSVFQAVILAAAITMVTSSFTRMYDEQIYHFLASTGLLPTHRELTQQWSVVPEQITDHVVILGYGRHGRRLVEACEEHGQPYVVVESNPALVEELESGCEAYVFGDIVEPKTMERAKMSDARLVVSTVESLAVNEHLLSASGDVDVVVRTKGRENARHLLDRGAYYVAVSDVLAADWLETKYQDLVGDGGGMEALRQELRDEVEMHEQPRRRRRG